MEKELVQQKPISEQITPLVQRQPEEEEEPLMTKGISGRTQQVRDNLHIRLNRSGGQPLPEADRSFMERRFGIDFSGVRVHTDSNAVQMSRELNAQAFTHGRDIYFGTGRYSPGTSSGKRLLAHELVHVTQQKNREIIRRFPADLNTVTMVNSIPLARQGSRNYLVGILTEMYVGSDRMCVSDFDGEIIDEDVSPVSSNCPFRPRQHTAQFTIGQPYSSRTFGRFPAKKNTFYDAHVMGLHPYRLDFYRRLSCTSIQNQFYKYAGRNISQYTLTRSYGDASAGNRANLRTTKRTINECLQCP